MEVHSRVESNVVVKPKPELLEVLKSAGAEGESFTVQEVLAYLNHSINDPSFFNMKEPREIQCGNHKFGKAFGFEMFKNTDLPQLLMDNLVAVESFDKSSPGGSNSCVSRLEKRKYDNDHEEEDALKKQRNENSLYNSHFSPCYIEICPTPDYDSSPESVSSIQGYETAFVKDSSDEYETEAEFELRISEDFDEELVEFEVNSLSSGIHEVFSDTDDEIAEFVSTEILVVEALSDREFWADSSSDESEGSNSDPEITDGDKWTCKHCSSINKPTGRFCQKCWQLRNGWVGGRRRQRRRRTKKFQRTLSAPDGVPAECSVAKPRRRSSLSLSDLTVEKGLQPSSSLGESTGESSGSLESVPSTSSSTSTMDSHLCSICLSRPKNSGIQHGNSVHAMCCYACGIKLWREKGRCPVCRRTIQRIVQVFEV
ncbi:E3 ubiquitin-protein ligase Mdm2 [Chamberlinius hualienensis]